MGSRRLAGVEGFGGAARAGAVLTLAAMVLSACATAPRPAPTAGLGAGGASGLHGTDKPYQVNGRWYYPHAQPGYNEVGWASWYGAQFHNRHTADGEIFDQFGLSAAHTTLPLPSIVEVTNLDNGRSVRLRLNDRGPFVGDRLIDVSEGAAEELGFRRQGLTRVRVRYVGPAPLEADHVMYASNAPTRRRTQQPVAEDQSADDTPINPRDADQGDADQPAAPPPSPPPPVQSYEAARDDTPADAVSQSSAPNPYAEPSTNLAPASSVAASAPAEGPTPVASAPPPVDPAPTPPPGAFKVQAAAFSNFGSAQRVADQLGPSGAAQVLPVTNAQGARLYRVVLSGYPNAGAAEAARAQVAAAGFDDARVIAPF